MTPQSRLEGMCIIRIQAENKATRRVELNQNDYECLYQCNGYNKSCRNYTGLSTRERLVGLGYIGGRR